MDDMFSSYFLICILTLAIFLIVMRLNNFPLISRVAVYLFCLVIIFTLIYENFLPGSVNLFALEYKITKKLLASTLWGILSFIIVFVVGVFLSARFFQYGMHPRKVNLRLARDYSNRNIIKPQVSLILGALLVFTGTLFISLTYQGEIMSREEYIPTRLEGNILMPLLRIVFLLAAVLLALSSYRYRISSFIFMSLGFLALLGTGSRMMGLYLTIFVLCVIIFSRRKRSYVSSFIGLCFAFYVSIMSINLRSLSGHGLAHYTEVLLDPKSFEFVSSALLFFVYYTFVMPIYAAANTIRFGSNYIEKVFITSINPLPGNFTNWASYSPEMRINIFAPYTFFGELLVFGNGVIYIFGLIIGITLGLIESRYSAYHLNRYGRYFYILAMVMMIFLLLLSLQYNLRSCLRFLYYSWVLIIIAESANLLNKNNVKKYFG
jgi:hypothetical protein